MQLTDWLVVIFIVAIVVVLVDGVRRKLAERRNRVVLKLDRNIPQDVDPDEFPISELPNGGARAIPREGQPVPSLRTLQAKRKLAFRSARIAEDPATRAVPVLLDTVDVEEERIEHTNVYVDPHAAASFQADDFAADDGPESAAARRESSFAERASKDDADEFIDGLDEEFEEDAMLAEPEVARKEPGYMETRYQGRRDDDDDEDDYEDEEEDDEEEEDDDLEEFDDDLDEDDEEDDEDDDDLDEDDDEELDDDDEDDDDFDDDDEEEDDDEDEDEEDLDELEGLPEDEWGAEEEQDVLVDDYENEPMPLQGAFDKAASQLDKVASQAASQLDKVASQAASQLDRVASHAASQFDRAATQAASHFNRPPRQDAPRIEPGFGDDGAAASFDDTNFSEDFSGAWDEAADAADTAESPAPRPGDARKRTAAAPKAAAGKRDQGELFSRPKAQPREENRLMAALQKAVPRGTQPEPAAAPAATVPQEVIIINVMARPGHVLHGAELLSVLQAQGLRLGDMSIFHRHADSHGSGPTMFSMANMVKPGTFDLATIDTFTTPGVSFFLQMPNKLGNMNCFDKMLGAASAVRDAFDAELKDEHRSVFTRQTVEHCRQRVRDFELKLLSRK